MKPISVKRFSIAFSLFVIALFAGLAFLIIYGDATLLIPMPIITIWVGAGLSTEYQDFRDKMFDLKTAAPLFIIGLASLAAFFFLTRADQFILGGVFYLVVIISFFLLAVRSNEQARRRTA